MLSKSINSRIDKLIENISKEFDLKSLSKSSARFNLQKLKWFNKEYLKMMNLVEFAYRSSDFKLKNSFRKIENQEKSTQNFRIGDYVMLVDIKKQKVFANKSKSPTGQDGDFYLLGGGRESNEKGLESLIREAKEESLNKIILEPQKIQKICDFRVNSQKKWQRDDQSFDGKELNVYFYPIEVEEIKSFVLTEKNEKNQEQNWKFDWYNLNEVLESNNFLTYPIWHNFCLKNNLECLTPSNKIILSYLGFSLDKNRIETLDQISTESDCILNWQKPDKDDVKWKKIETKESLENLKEIYLAIKKMFYDKHTKLENKLLHLAIKNLLSHSLNPKTNPENTQIDLIFASLSKEWEAEIKLWLSDNQKQTGDYLWPLRVALSGKIKSPSPFELLAILSKEEVEYRIHEVLKYL
jgi:glutamyl/glutaminyl-tRNA synthetase